MGGRFPVSANLRRRIGGGRPHPLLRVAEHKALRTRTPHMN